jgi:hypothetical protein
MRWKTTFYDSNTNTKRKDNVSCNTADSGTHQIRQVDAVVEIAEPEQVAKQCDRGVELRVK